MENTVDAKPRRNCVNSFGTMFLLAFNFDDKLCDYCTPPFNDDV